MKILKVDCLNKSFPTNHSKNDEKVNSWYWSLIVYMDTQAGSYTREAICFCRYKNRG